MCKKKLLSNNVKSIILYKNYFCVIYVFFVTWKTFPRDILLLKIISHNHLWFVDNDCLQFRMKTRGDY